MSHPGARPYLHLLALRHAPRPVLLGARRLGAPPSEVPGANERDGDEGRDQVMAK